MSKVKLLTDIDLQAVLKLEIGSGNAPKDGYVHLDIREDAPEVDIACDFGSLPFELNQLDEVRCCQTIGCIPRWRREVVLKEWLRVLKPGGCLWLDTPNLEGWIEQFNKGQADCTSFIMRLYGGQLDKYDVQYIAYTTTSLLITLQQVGFKNLEALDSTCWSDIHLKAYKKK